MNGTRPLRGRAFALSVSVLALLALACFPVLAQADSSGSEYIDAPPSATGEQPTTRDNPPANASKGKDGGTGPSNQSNSPSSEGENSDERPDSEGGGIAGSGKDGGNGQGSPGKSKGNEAKGGSHNASPAPAGASEKSDDGGSSPLVPILIAIAVLAAVSIGALLLRQRRQNDGGSVSPEAS